ncbi:MAG: glycosyltransferase involved in cell wall biosynthesis [Lentisphaeria bacterium]|jgi:glycosyltransferase involved in cell wall biosynthesis
MQETENTTQSSTSAQQEDNNTTPSSQTATAKLSVVIPFYNEEGNILLLLKEVEAALASYRGNWEIIAVNDGSSDKTSAEMEQARKQMGSHVCCIHFARNFGQTAAMQAGISAAKGELIVTLDGDRQNDPADIPQMIEHLLEHEYDMVAGWRKNRQDAQINRKIPSKIANWLIRRATGVAVKDYGCSLKLYRAHVIKQVVLIGEMHRFIPAWVACVTDPDRIGQMEVNHRAREVGVSKYGISRTFRVILDLLAVTFFMRYSRRPGHFFGIIGLTAGGAGGAILTYLLAIKIFADADVGSRPLFFTGILLVMAGIQLITTGVLAEIQTRNAGNYVYPVRKQTEENSRTWHVFADK